MIIIKVRQKSGAKPEMITSRRLLQITGLANSRMGFYFSIVSKLNQNYLEANIV